jgi:hypothetical protein
MNQQKKKRKGVSINKEKPPGERKPQCKPLSLSEFTFDEIVDIALNTKPKKQTKRNEEVEKE